MKIPTICPYCGGKVQLTDSSVIYNKSYGNIYLCLSCNAFAGVHKNTNRPLGTLANSVLRKKRLETHKVFDGFWKNLKMTRSEGYAWLSKELGIPKKLTHIGYFDMETCEKVIEACKKVG